MSLLFDIALVAGLIALALHVVVTRDGRGAILAFIAFGLLLGIGWARLASVDVALTEAAIGGGLTGMLLLRAHAHLAREIPPEAMSRAVPRSWLAPAIACGLVTLALGAVVLAFPQPAPSLAHQAVASLETTGLGNPVTAVLLAYRAIDTLLEKIVLILALVGVWSLSRDAAWGGASQLRPAVIPEPLVFLARVLPPFGVLIAVYQVWVGADLPGGTFQAGTILAAMALLVMLAGLRPAPQTQSKALRVMLAGGPALFVLVGFLGVAVAQGFLSYPEAIAKPLIVGIEAALTLSIAGTLALLVAGPPDRAPAP
ncbi:MAG TPA: MnhB domain-containing protein [Bosea sp. (in: a-proteobacteria)]|jgi:multisubunit Na+/H+ antiporter MnhB subunit|uniref:MnhB domain-containing protein n=1 Tax=Bosea sp. (in: a-proteobacteria) TaxID=1871050 RepID=UPI002DDC93B4|nr:MnhB domain-containing protein [Bosea sp. (in: a-proteobacteria)]HEV2553109.1 MnhB domain-containing protein [Bosea sp. (in: a-proteobacteria)]